MSLSKKNNYLVLYLDFDGVLNNDRFLRRQYNLAQPEQYVLFDPKNMLAFNYLCQHLLISEIVISSSWREGGTTQELAQLLADNGFTHAHLVTDVTPIGRNRVEEIKAHLTKHQIKKFLVLDDISLHPMQPPQFFRVPAAVGLTQTLCDKILHQLNTHPPP